MDSDEFPAKIDKIVQDRGKRVNQAEERFKFLPESGTIQHHQTFAAVPCGSTRPQHEGFRPRNRSKNEDTV